MTVGFLLNVLSPGTKVRQSALTKIDAVSAIKSAISVGIKNINLWLDLAPVIVALLIMPIILKLVICAFKQNNFKFSNPLLLLIGSVMWLCAMYCPSLYATGAAGAGRLQNIVWYSFIILFFINVFYISGWVMNKVDMKYKSNEVAFINAKWICFVLTMLMGLYLAKWNGVWSSDWNGAWSAKAVQELKQGEAQRYSKQAFDRYKVLLNSSAQDVIVKDYSDKPETLFSSDISEDVNHWRNQDLRNYFGLNSVRIEK
ncbi:hypothetical protein D3Z56_05765 [Lachnospiraceae bacterium]|nr:hypothetical protein [Lachnospiraceae bacterium]